MKKIPSRILCIFILALMLFSVTACTGGAKQTFSEDGKGQLTTANYNQTVKIELPLSVLSEEDQNDIDAYCEKRGYINAKINKRKETVTITMKELSYDLMKGEIGMEVIKTIYSFENNKDYPYFNKVESYDKEHFSKVVFSADGSLYKKNSLAAYNIGQSCLLYQLYEGSGVYKVEVEVIDKDTKEVIDTQIYSDKE